MRTILVLAVTIAWAAVARTQAVTLTVLDPTGGTYHAHNVGADFSITVTATWSGAGFVYWEWQDCDKQQISGRGATRLQNGVQVRTHQCHPGTARRICGLIGTADHHPLPR